MRTDAAARLTRKIYEYHLGALYVPSVGEKLLDDLRSTLADTHSTKSAIARVAVASENHFAAAAHHLAHILVDDSLMGGHIDTAVFFCG